VRPFLIYTGGRILLLAAVAALLYAAGLRGFGLAALALLLSLPLSYVLLASPRVALAERVERRLAKRRARREGLRSRLRGDDEPAA
jgi:Protein of unknown function (DUF4229)